MEITTKNLCGADLYNADLYNADLCGANLCGANLYNANLRCANLYNANLYNANLRGANIDKSLIPLVCPEFGSFTAFKKAGGCLVTLIIPEDALRSSATGRKCRCNKAKVVDILPLSEKIKRPIQSIPSDYDNNFIYTVGETVEVDDFDTNRFNECAAGIHFFITKQEAIDY